MLLFTVDVLQLVGDRDILDAAIGQLRLPGIPVEDDEGDIAGEFMGDIICEVDGESIAGEFTVKGDL